MPKVQQQNTQNQQQQQQQSVEIDYRGFEPSEVRAVALSRAAGRFGRNILRNTSSIIDGEMLRHLTNVIRSTASLGHRSSIVLWGPPEGGKRSTLEALAQIFCVYVDRTTNSVSRSTLNASGGSGGNKGIPILGIVLDGSALRSDNDAAQAVLSSLYDFWWLVCDVRSRKLARASKLGLFSSNPKGTTTGQFQKQTKQQKQKQKPQKELSDIELGIPEWVTNGDEILSWLFQEALPETLHKQPPPSAKENSFASSSSSSQQQQQNNSNNQNQNQNTNFSGGILGGQAAAQVIANRTSASAASLSSFRTTIAQTFRVFTHGGTTVLQALQTALLELSKCGISPCFFIHDIRSFGQNCDKIVYMISGLLHEQELMAAEENDSSNSNQNSNTKGSNKNNNSNNANNNSSSSSCGGGMSIVMTSVNADLRLEKRLSSRMNSDFFYCAQKKLDFSFALSSSFVAPQEETQEEDAVLGHGGAESGGSNSIEGAAAATLLMFPTSHQQGGGSRRQRLQLADVQQNFSLSVREVEHTFLQSMLNPSHVISMSYGILSKRCAELGRPSHLIRRLIECWFDLAYEVSDFTRVPVSVSLLEKEAIGDVHPLHPLDSLMTEYSHSCPREMLCLLACVMHSAAQQRRVGVVLGAASSSSSSSNNFSRSVQEHYTLFQEMRTSSANNDSIDAWMKAAGLLRRWGIITTSSSASSGNTFFTGATKTAANNNAGTSSNNHNVASTLTSTTKIDLLVENWTELQNRVNQYSTVVFDQTTLTSVRTLLR